MIESFSNDLFEYLTRFISLFDIFTLTWTSKSLRLKIIEHSILKKNIRNMVSSITCQFVLREPAYTEYHYPESSNYYPIYKEIAERYDDDCVIESDIKMNKFHIKDGTVVAYGEHNVAFRLGIFRIGMDNYFLQDECDNYDDGAFIINQEHEQILFKKRRKHARRYELINLRNSKILKFLRLITTYLGYKYEPLIIIDSNERAEIFHHPGNSTGFPALKCDFVDIIEALENCNLKEVMPRCYLFVGDQTIYPFVVDLELCDI